MALFKTLVPPKPSLSTLSIFSKCSVHIPRYQEPDQYNLPVPDLGLIIAKCRFLSFHDDMTNSNTDIDAIDSMENGSFLIQLSTTLPHATYLVYPIWKTYCKQFSPSKYDIECMLNYYNTNESWTNGSYFINKNILNREYYEPILLSSKSWKYICEISLKATNHNECLCFLDNIIKRSNPQVIEWKEMVKIFLIKRAFYKIIDYSSYII
eukprot:269940_1